MTSFSITSPALEATHPQKTTKKTNRQIIKFSPSWQEMTSPLPVIMSNIHSTTQPQKDIFTTRVRSAMSNTTSLFAPLPLLLVASGGATFLWFACSGAGNKFHNGSRQLCWRMPAQRQIRRRRKVGGWCWLPELVSRWGRGVLPCSRNNWAGILQGELCFNARGRARGRGIWRIV